jgi:sigma-E factor negative regulatory protein RseC
MNETGEVIGLSGDTVTLLMKRTSSCGSCRACSAGRRTGEMQLTAVNLCGAKLNDKVTVELHPKAFVSAAAVLYGIPLVGMLFGFISGNYLFERLGLENSAAFAGFAFGVVFLFLIYKTIKRFEYIWRGKGYAPAAVKVVAED